MGYFDSLLAAGQIEESDGRVRFHPYGVFGVGYRLLPEQANQVKRFLTAYYAVTFPVAVLGAQTYHWVGWPATLALLALVLGLTTVWYVFRMRQLLTGAERVATRLTLGENARNMAEKAGLPTTILMLVLSTVMTLTGVWALFATHTWQNRAIGLLGTILFGLCLGVFAYQLNHLVRRSVR